MATTIPDEIQKIPPDDPAYNVKYVYIYDVQPDVVYMGYTPGYIGCYVYGPTVVYGTGWSYRCWHGSYYYPRPFTWGFSMHYSPWTGWSMGYGRSERFFRYSYHSPGWHGGWWGPPKFHPPYFVPYNHYYGSKPVVLKNTRIINNNPNRNIFRQTNVYKNNASGVRIYSQQQNQNPVKRESQPVPNQPVTKGKAEVKPVPEQIINRENPTKTAKKSNVPNNVLTSQDGNIYRKKGNNYETFDGKEWKPAETKTTETKPIVKPQNVIRQQPQKVNPPQPQNVTRQQPQNFNRQELDKQVINQDRGVVRQVNQSTFQRNTSGGVQKVSSGGSQVKRK